MTAKYEIETERLIKEKLGDDQDIYEILAIYKEENTHKADYGLGDDGITPGNTEQIRNLYRRLGYAASHINKPPKTLVSEYKRGVGRVVDRLLQWANRNERYLNNYCYAGYISNFLKLNQSDFMKIMVENHSKVSPYPPTTTQKTEWRKIQSCLKTIFKQKSTFNNLYIIFEYVLPLKSWNADEDFYKQVGVRPDVILLSRDAVLTIEFKDRQIRRTETQFLTSQAKKYARKIKQYHELSQNMEHIDSILVSLVEEKMHAEIDGIKCYSPDYLASGIKAYMGAHPEKMPNPEKWIQSNWIR